MINNKQMELENASDENQDVETESDDDTCDETEITKIFNKKTSLITQKQVIDGVNKYILHIDGTKDTSPNIAIATSDSDVGIYSLSAGALVKLHTLDFKDGSCIGIKFSSDNNNLVFTGYDNGNILLWDLRTPAKHHLQFNDTTVENKNKTFSCFDVSANGRFLSAGTELYEGDAFLLFWDTRSTKLLGGYWESHTDDITNVQFHPDDSDKLISSSTDGLINIYDISQTAEEDALLESLNTESSVEQIKWFKNGNSDAIFCSTHTHDVQLWKLEDAEPYAHFKRERLGAEIKRKCIDHSYVANAHITTNNDLMLLVGSNYKDGACLRALTAQKTGLNPVYNFKENNQRVRCTWFNKYTNTLVSGGEKGFVNIWKLGTTN